MIESKIKLADATSAKFPILNNPTIVVTEPFLGTPKKQVVDVAEASKELDKIKKLYLGFLKNIYSQKEKINLSTICLVFPVYELKGRESRSLFEETLDEIENLGYTISCSLKYGRDYQVVKRQIVLLEPKNQ